MGRLMRLLSLRPARFTSLTVLSTVRSTLAAVFRVARLIALPVFLAVFRVARFNVFTVFFTDRLTCLARRRADLRNPATMAILFLFHCWVFYFWCVQLVIKKQCAFENGIMQRINPEQETE